MARTIRNFDALASTALRRDALAIAEAGYAAIDLKQAIARKVRIDHDELHIDGHAYALAGRRVYFVGVGKCAIATAEALSTLLGDRLTAGIALDVEAESKRAIDRVEVYVGTHPLPSEVNERATERIIQFLAGRQPEDLVIMLISGGGSTLLCLHEKPMTCLDEQVLFEALTAKGASIQELNTVRKHLSLARGGRLAAAAYPAQVAALIISDVPGHNMQFIASGPTVADTSSVADAAGVLSRYQLALPNGIALLETPKDEKYFERVDNILFLTNRDALVAMEHYAGTLGYATSVVNDCVRGEAREIGMRVVRDLHDAIPQTVYLYAGETTVTLGAHAGRGGRNQELALGALGALYEDEVIIPLASDGHDNSDHAGAVVDAQTQTHAKEHGLSIESHLAEHRSYDFFLATGDYLDTGALESNVSDLIIAIKSN